MKIKKECPCGVEFMVFPSQKRKYCSMNCYSNDRREQISHHQWRWFWSVMFGKECNDETLFKKINKELYRRYKKVI